MKNIGYTIAAAAAAGAALYLYFVGADCLFLKYFHVICPGCGMTRAVRAVLHLNFKEAFMYHPMVFALPLIGLYVIKSGEIFRKRVVNYTILGLLVSGFIINYLIKLYLQYWRV